MICIFDSLLLVGSKRDLHCSNGVASIVLIESFSILNAVYYVIYVYTCINYRDNTHKN